MLASYMNEAGDKDSSLQAFQVGCAELSLVVSCHLCASFVMQSCGTASAGADEEFRLSMELLRPAYGQVTPLSMPTTRLVTYACSTFVLLTPASAMLSCAFAGLTFHQALWFVK